MADPKVIPLPGWHRGINALDQSATEGQVADALDAPPGDRLVVKDDGSLNTTLADRVVVLSRRPGRIREIVTIPMTRAERGTADARGQMAALQGELWSLIRKEAIDAEREVQHA